MENDDTHAIFSDGDRQGSSNSSSLSSLLSQSGPSSPDILKEDDVNISGTGRIDGRRLPFKIKDYYNQNILFSSNSNLTSSLTQYIWA